MDAGGWCARYAGDVETLQNDAMAAAYALAGYDAVNLGANEFRDGEEPLTALFTRYNVPAVTANVRARTGDVPPTVIVRRGGVTVTVVGVVDESLLNEETSAAAAPAKDALAAAVADVAPRADYVVALIYVKDLAAARRAAGACPADVDVVVAAGLGGELPYAEEIAGRWLVYARPWNRYVGLLKVVFDEGAPVAAENTFIPLTKEMTPDDDGAALVAAYRAKLRELVIAKGLLLAPTGATPSGYAFVGSAACAGCHEGPTAQWRASGHARAYADLVADGRDFDPACVKCHVTGYGFVGGFASAAATPDRLGVGCEKCHGPASAHVAGPPGGLNAVGADVCIRCHASERSPTFNYGEYLARIKH